jgi:hypothetical protein
MPSLYGGLLIATIWSVPGLNLLNCFCCAGVLLGGFLAVLLYQRDQSPESGQLTRDECTQLGIYAGLISAVAGVVIQYVVMAMFGNVMIDVMMKIVERMNVDLPPEYFEMIEMAKASEQSLFSFILDIIIMGIMNTLFAFLGAMIGWKVFQPKPAQ